MFFSPKLVSRYRELKLEVPDCVLFMQVGAFMQVMDECAREEAENEAIIDRGSDYIDGVYQPSCLWGRSYSSRASFGRERDAHALRHL